MIKTAHAHPAEPAAAAFAEVPLAVHPAGAPGPVRSLVASGTLRTSGVLELEYRLAPLLTVSGYFEGALAPFPYAAQRNLGDLSDASEIRLRLQVSVDVSPRTAVDVGYDFTRWHASFSGSSVLDPSRAADQALLLEAREHAITFGVRWKP